jgi:hypothetical protein
VANAEIDLLMESPNYFMFIEAKKPHPGKMAIFAPGNMHQLVRQLIEGRMLSKLINKEFMLATLGSSQDWGPGFKPNENERRLLDLVGLTSVHVPNFPWKLLPEP